MIRRHCFPMFALLALAPASLCAEHKGKIQILLLGDSTTMGSVCRQVEPKGPHLEDVVRALLAAEKDLPPTNVINKGLDGDYIQGLLKDGRYDKEIAKLPGLDYIFIRYGLNDSVKIDDFKTNFPKDMAALIKRLRADHPEARIIPTTTIPYFTAEKDEEILAAIRAGAKAEKLPVFDLYTRYAEELKQGQNMLTYRRFALSQIPEAHREWVQPFVHGGAVAVMDNRLDAHFGKLPGWFGDRHPNLAGYHVIGDETAKYLTPLIREKAKQ